MMILDKYRRIQKSREETEETERQAAEPRSQKRKQSQKKTNLKVLPTQPKNTHLEDIQSLTDNELIAACARPNATRRQWQQFYKRYTPLINTRIEVTLLKIGIPQRAITWDIADEVSFAVMKKLCDGKSLKTIAGYQYAKAGLGQAVENIVRSWNRERNLQKHAHEAHVQKNLTSLDAPLGEEVDDECLIEVIADPRTNPIPGIEVEATRENITQLMREVESIKDNRKRLAFKVNVIFYNPLSDEDIKEIAALRGIAPSEIETEVDAIVARLADQNEQIERQYDLMANKFYDLQSQIGRLRKMEKDFNTPETELKELERDIARKTKELENLNKRNQMVNVYPTAEEVAKLLKIPKEKQKDIAVWLNRIRKKLENIKLRNKQQGFAS